MCQNAKPTIETMVSTTRSMHIDILPLQRVAIAVTVPMDITGVGEVMPDRDLQVV